MIFNYSFDYKHNPMYSGTQPVAVVVNFNTDGRFIPIYFRYVSYDSSESTFKISGVKYTRDRHDSTVFCCLFHNGNIQQEVFLTFQHKECIWVLENT